MDTESILQGVAFGNPAVIEVHSDTTIYPVNNPISLTLVLGTATGGTFTHSGPGHISGNQY